MKLVAALVLLVLCASNAGATDIAGKWGVGAVVGTTVSEFSLIRGRSEKSAWVLDLGVTQATGSTDIDDSANSLPAVGGTSNHWSINGGPGLRRFTRPQADFSPYLDVFLHGQYAHQHDHTAPYTSNLATWGASAGLAFGLEYFTKWHCSFALHSELASVSWTRQTQETSTVTLRNDQQRAALGISPQLFVRAYF